MIKKPLWIRELRNAIEDRKMYHFRKMLGAKKSEPTTTPQKKLQALDIATIKINEFLKAIDE